MRMPPGFAGRIARYFFLAAPRPLPEAAIAATLGYLAGVCGGSHTISKPRTGLNLYVILLALSGMGKEPLHRVTYLLRRVCQQNANLVRGQQYVFPNRSASAPALSRRLAKNPSMVQVVGELGRLLTEMANAQTSSPMFGLMTLWTELYEKSGPDSTVAGTDYSDEAKNIDAILGACYSVLGESTGETFYGAITATTLENGFLSRWTAVECERTEMPERNADPTEEPDPELLDVLACMLYHCIQQRRSPLHLQFNAHDDAEVNLDDFRASCDAAISQAGTDQGRRAVWNRAHVKAWRIAGLLACADYYMHLCGWFRSGCQGEPPRALITEPHVEWACMLTTLNAKAILSRLETGKVGTSDDTRQLRLLHIMHEYLSTPLPPSYGVPQEMQRDGIVPRKYLQRRTSGVAAFCGHTLGAKRALDDAIHTCLDNGYMVEMPKEKAGEMYTYQGKCYRIVQLPKFDSAIDA